MKKFRSDKIGTYVLLPLSVGSCLLSLLLKLLNFVFVIWVLPLVINIVNRSHVFLNKWNTKSAQVETLRAAETNSRADFSKQNIAGVHGGLK